MKRRHVIGTALLFMLTAVTLMPGCQWKGRNGAAADRGNEVWRVDPQRVRVYPSTRITTNQGATWLEARVEFLDGMDDSCKAVGTMRFELLAAGTIRERAAGEMLYAWNTSLLTLNDQHAWDEVTRTYRFRLKLDDDALLQRDVVLLTWFTPVEGDRLEARTRLSKGVVAGD